MKSIDELWEKYRKDKINGAFVDEFINYSEFTDAIIEDRQQIKDMVEQVELPIEESLEFLPDYIKSQLK